MAKVDVRMFATVREAAGTPAIEVEASNLGELLDVLAGQFGPQMARLISRARKDSEQLVILVNGRNTQLGGKGSATLQEGDEISIFPPVSGG